MPTRVVDMVANPGACRPLISLGTGGHRRPYTVGAGATGEDFLLQPVAAGDAEERE